MTAPLNDSQAKRLLRLHRAELFALEAYCKAKTAKGAETTYAKLTKAEDNFLDALELLSPIRIDRQTREVIE